MAAAAEEIRVAKINHFHIKSRTKIVVKTFFLVDINVLLCLGC